ncbi:hypothetical protein M427DRAFT_51336 [Gonapodya prolifera JEL478]|uniref:Uncharacterized protein n=1 Tax=Gonapodya prolifera (strain JEL478) TaxID=1344416 RepID=A0A139AZ37_GONPJ|nr:hypothetical protein M427DRAFT_51336 [Gonapodya prolifera JEL478]|eukprot:KXS21970.1 hypothetical protein M427DRAFT_51336 [Gonapodya prolifera JEL478]
MIQVTRHRINGERSRKHHRLSHLSPHFGDTIRSPMAAGNQSNVECLCRREGCPIKLNLRFPPGTPVHVQVQAVTAGVAAHFAGPDGEALIDTPNYQMALLLALERFVTTTPPSRTPYRNTSQRAPHHRSSSMPSRPTATELELHGRIRRQTSTRQPSPPVPSPPPPSSPLVIMAENGRQDAMRIENILN